MKHVRDVFDTERHLLVKISTTTKIAFRNEVRLGGPWFVVNIHIMC